MELETPKGYIRQKNWDKLGGLLTDISFLEAKAKGKLVFDLIDDFQEARRNMPKDHRLYNTIVFLGTALANDADFISRHPKSLFQCMWNSCWWYDSEQSQYHYKISKDKQNMPWDGEEKFLSSLMEKWKREKEAKTPGFFWIRSLRPLSPGGHFQRLQNLEESYGKKIEFSSDGIYLTAWYNSSNSTVWKIGTGEIQTIAPTSYHPTNVSPDGKYIVLKGEPDSSQEMVNGKKVLFYDVGDDYFGIEAVLFSQDGRWLVLGCWPSDDDGELQVWDRVNHTRKICLKTMGRIQAVAISDDAKIIASASYSVLQFWDMDGNEIKRLYTHENYIRALAFSPDGQQIACWGKEIRIWNWQNALPEEIFGANDYLQEIVFSPDKKYLITVAENDSTWMWNAQNGAPHRCLLKGHGSMSMGGSIRDAIFVGSQRIILLSLSGRNIWDGDGNCIRKGKHFFCDDSEGYLYDLSFRGIFAPSGDYFAAWYSNSHKGEGVELKIISMSTGKVQQRPNQHDGEISSGVFSPNNLYFAYIAKDRILHFWSIEEEKQLYSKKLDYHIRCLAFSHDNYLIATGFREDVHLYTATTGDKILHLSTDGSVQKLAFSQDNTKIFTYSSVIQIWEVSTGSLIKTLPPYENFFSIVNENPWELSSTTRNWKFSPRKRKKQLPGFLLLWRASLLI